MGEERILFTKQMKKDYTILIPTMVPTHFRFLENVFKNNGYHAEILHNEGPSVVREGLKYVHNDTCYPATLVIGQMLDALNSGKYDVTKVALMITQTGGGCRASNYIHLLRKALKKAGYSFVPVISINLSGMEKNPGFKLTIPIIRQLAAGFVYGDALDLLANRLRPYENNKGETNHCLKHWIDKISAQFAQNKGFRVKEIAQNLSDLAADFDKISRTETEKIKVGIVGEIYVKYSPLGNNHLQDFLENQGCETNLPGLMGFMFYCLVNKQFDQALYGGQKIAAFFSGILIRYFKKLETLLIDTVQKHPFFHAPVPFSTTIATATPLIGHGCKMGEGWLLTAEMAELYEHGYENIICTQPFGCLPNHIAGKGMIQKLQALYPRINIVPIDYDPSATAVNQENRIKLMLSVARENLKQKQTV